MVLEKDKLVDASQLRVGTAGGIVELRGLLASEEERHLAVRDVWYVPGVWNVVDHIEVRPAPHANSVSSQRSAATSWRNM